MLLDPERGPRGSVTDGANAPAACWEPRTASHILTPAGRAPTAVVCSARPPREEGARKWWRTMETMEIFEHSLEETEETPTQIMAFIKRLQPSFQEASCSRWRVRCRLEARWILLIPWCWCEPLDVADCVCSRPVGEREPVQAWCVERFAWEGAAICRSAVSSQTGTFQIPKKNQTAGSPLEQSASSPPDPMRKMPKTGENIVIQAGKSVNRKHWWWFLPHRWIPPPERVDAQVKNNTKVNPDEIAAEGRPAEVPWRSLWLWRLIIPNN